MNCSVCHRDVSEFDKIYQIYLTPPDTYTDCLEQTVVCTVCIGEFGENPEIYIKFQDR